MLTNEEIEKLEHKYFHNLCHALSIDIPAFVKSLESMNKIKEYWRDYFKETDGFDAGFERVIYSAIQGRMDLGKPNSAPAGADLFFENEESFIHIDLKSNNCKTNTDDHWKPKMNANQSSYEIQYRKQGQSEMFNFDATLPEYYSYTDSNNNTIKKPTITYLITILYYRETNNNIFENLKILSMNVSCMPNGQLKNIYGEEPVSAGGNISVNKIRFNMSNCQKFKLLDDKVRIYKIYQNDTLFDSGINIKSKQTVLEFLSGLKQF